MFNKLLPKTEFSRNVFTLVKGTSIAQAIPMLIAPVLARIYTPDELGALAYMVSIVAVLSVVSTGRYEMAILLPESDTRARNVLALSVMVTFFSNILLLVAGFVFYDFFNHILTQANAPGTLLWIFPLVFTLAAYQGLYYWYNRNKDYKLLSQNRVVQNATNGVLNIVAGLMSFHLIGLLFSRLVSQVVTVLYLLVKKKVPYKGIEKKEIVSVAAEYNRFPKYLIFAHSLNSISLQLPVFLITSFFGATIVGFFAMAQRVIMTPLAIISNSIGDVFRQEASEEFNRSGNCRGIYARTLKRLIYISILPFLLFYFLAPWLFTFIFGDDWAATGEYAQILTFLFFMQFITRPLTNIFLVAQKQRADAVWQVLLFLSTALSFLVGYYYFNSVLISLTLFSISRGICYLIALVMGYFFSKG